MMKFTLPSLVKFMVYLVFGLLLVNLIVILSLHGEEVGKKLLILPNKASEKPKTEDAGRVFPVDTTVRPTQPRVKSSYLMSCPDLRMPQINQSGLFQSVEDSMVFLYSAFVDDDVVRIIALRPAYENKPFFCHLWSRSQDDDPLSVTSATIEDMPENHERSYTASFFKCTLPPELKIQQLFAVSIVTEICQSALNSVLVQRPGIVTSQFTVCVTPLNFKYSRADELLEMLEMNKILGAEKIVFYNHSTGPNVDQVLHLYSLSEEVDVHPWHLPIDTDTWPPSHASAIHYFGQLAALNDCLYRYRNQSAYLVFTDLDEFIVPRNTSDWNDLIQQREALYSNDVSVFQMKCVFYRKEWTKPGKSFETLALKYNSAILKHTERENTYFPYDQRSKYIVNPRMTSVVGVHNVWKTHGLIDQVPESVAAVHHYRSWEQPNDSQPRIPDDIAVRKFGKRLADRLTVAWSLLNGVPLSINISTYGDSVSRK